MLGRVKERETREMDTETRDSGRERLLRKRGRERERDCTRVVEMRGERDGRERGG